MEHSLSFGVRVVEVLRASAVFGALTEEILQALARVMEERWAHGGEEILREGDESDSIVFVISGGLRVSRRDRNGQLLLYNQVQPGQSVGELGMILKQARAQTVTALRDSRLASLSRRAYEDLLRQFPLELSQVFLKAVYDRMRNATDVGTDQRMAQTYALLPLHMGCDCSELAQDLSLALARMGRTAHLNRSPDGRHTHLNGEMLGHHDLSHLEDAYDFILYETRAPDGTEQVTQHVDGNTRSDADNEWRRFSLRQADQLVYVAASTDAPGLSALERALMREPAYALKRHHLVLMHPEQAAEPVLPEPWMQARELERIYPIRRGRRDDAERVARFLTGTAVGVVLGGGGARGFAHLGVLRALAECHIPVDLIGGNSMGALIGAQVACDMSLDQILQNTQKFAAGGERPTLPLISIVGGRRVERDLKRMFGERLIEGLWRPYFAAACNLTQGNTTVQDRGPLWRAVLASNSPAGLFPPVLLDGELLVDGAILENVPVQAMRMRLGTPLERRRGNGHIIAIDVDVRENLSADPGLQRLTVMSTLRRFFSDKAPASPSIADILYSAGHVGGLNQRFRTISQADHYLEPPVADFSLMAYAKGADIAEVGYRYAMEKISRWDHFKPAH
ncbi:cyclic nucleotide-binding and patatin-like phospholipase domain-containing protein [Roseateles koreensis]|uniref:Cyclic nucleotide-binding and patatin-like phospholipase domain-containing protein n=1 Tax=Roseateles koreensis TaxID=2987526 RepID=A0ABT5KSU8_9BURK|nr:cyclic nucleotide-binding and patatin-like phospholipase domain-containing protein [Roseateles koreensis]MDC8786013.1 cyclic nucleotide-binding and patatin-like phospholipase domain-containing protein [Roseateles koreensis]